MNALFGTPDRHYRFISFVLLLPVFLGLVALGMTIPLYSGLLSYALIMTIAPQFKHHQHAPTRARWWAALLIAVSVLVVLTIAAIGLHWLLGNGNGVHDLIGRMGDILASARLWLPTSVSELLPEPEELLKRAGEMLKAHAEEIGSLSLGALKSVGYVLIGLLLGAMIAIAEAIETTVRGPVICRLLKQVEQLRIAFWRVVIAQVKISAINTTLTAIYLVVVLPVFGVHLPFAKTLIAVTFFVGLLPVVGNLVSNTAITIISLSHSPSVAAASLAFLIVVHKLEYFINARIVGSQINARAWELLFWMILLERLLGPAGVVVAPVFCAWLKTEWRAWDIAESDKANHKLASVTAHEPPLQ